MPPESHPLKAAGTGGDSPPHGSAPLPLERSILWRPRGVAGQKAAGAFGRGVYPVFLEHDALAGLNRHLDRQEKEPRFGFLLGRLLRSPEHGVSYAVVDTAVAAREVLEEEASAAYLLRAWSEAQSVFSGHSGLLLGWYHSHQKLGLVPSDADHEVNARYFDAPWQVSIVVVPDRARPLGGVFRHQDGVAGGRVRPGAFYEILPIPHGGDIGAAESAVAWANYEAHRPSPPEPAPPPGPNPPPADREDEPAPYAGEERRSRPRVSLWSDDPPDEGKIGPEDRESRAARAPGERQRGVAMPTGAGSGGGSERQVAVPLVIPGENAEGSLLPPRSRRVSWPVLAAVGLAVVLAIFLLLPNDPSPRPIRTTPPGAGDARGGAGTPAVAEFLEEVRALEIAGERYAERALDFDAGRIGCDLLTTGYVAADEAYVRIAAAWADLPSRENPRAAAAYERAGEETAEVNAHFDGSGCPRP